MHPCGAASARPYRDRGQSKLVAWRRVLNEVSAEHDVQHICTPTELRHSAKMRIGQRQSPRGAARAREYRRSARTRRVPQFRQIATAAHPLKTSGSERASRQTPSEVDARAYHTESFDVNRFRLTTAVQNGSLAAATGCYVRQEWDFHPVRARSSSRSASLASKCAPAFIRASARSSTGRSAASRRPHRRPRRVACKSRRSARLEHGQGPSRWIGNPVRRPRHPRAEGNRRVAPLCPAARNVRPADAGIGGE